MAGIGIEHVSKRFGGVTAVSDLLLDEPLSNLDAKLRERMRWELKELQRRTGITFIYVTAGRSRGPDGAGRDPPRKPSADSGDGRRRRGLGAGAGRGGDVPRQHRRLPRGARRRHARAHPGRPGQTPEVGQCVGIRFDGRQSSVFG
jgi:hypothetical protein